MLFTSGEFLFVYLPLTLITFFLVARWLGHRAAAFWLTLASLVFYGYWRPANTPILVVSIIVNYLFGRLILDARRRGNAQSAKGLLAAAVAANLAALAYFKYANFLLDTGTEVLGLPPTTLDVVLPLGISFFTFTQIAYLADVHAGKVVERNPVHYGLFVTYFPHLIAGPVLHHSEMMPQFGSAEIYRARLRNFAIGLSFLCIGLAKKILIADSVAPFANEGFLQAEHASLAPLSAWLCLAAYTLQIYFDFSGYSDMAVGLSLLIGVRLPYNFNSPYKARNITDFWRRWHMTLSRFLRDYLYIPLGGNRQGRFRRYVNLMLTMLLGGLWHGASWTFVVWGGLHGLYLCVNHAWQWVKERLPGMQLAQGKVASRVLAALSVAITLFSVIVAWVFFRATTVDGAFGIIRSMFALNDAAPLQLEITSRIVVWIVVFSLVALLARNSQELVDQRLAPALERIATRRWSSELMAAMCGGMIVLIVLLAMISASRNVTEFIYFNF